MNFIKDKKINKYIVMAVLFLSFGYSGFYSMRGTLALFTAGMDFYVFNDVFIRGVDRRTHIRAYYDVSSKKRVFKA